MKFNISLLIIILFNSCKVDELIYEPKTTPEAWLQMRPSVNLGEIVFNEPLGSFLVFLLAFLWIYSGFYFLKNQNGESSRKWFGIALVLGGIGAAQQEQVTRHLVICLNAKDMNSVT